MNRTLHQLAVALAVALLVATVAHAAGQLPSFHPEFHVEHVTPTSTVHRRIAPAVPAGSVPEYIARIEASRSRLSQALAQSDRALPARLHPNDFFSFIPSFLAALMPGGPSASWNLPTACSTSATASLSALGSDGTATLTIELSHRRTLFCEDLYLFAAMQTFHIHEFVVSSPHTITFAGLSPADMSDIALNGLRVFHFASEVIQDVVDVWETALLFLQGNLPVGPPDVSPAEAAENLAFLQEAMGVTMPPRSAGIVNISKETVNSGDFLGIIRLDGLDPMIAWGMGAHTGHTTVALWLPTGASGEEELYVTESQTNSHYWPNNHIQKTPWDEWIAMATDASYNVVYLPLKPEAAAAFDEAAAQAFFGLKEGNPYGFGSFLFGWIDSASGNFPAPLSEQLVMVLFSMVQGVSPNATELIWNQALNHRLNTSGLDCFEVYAEAAARGLTFGELISIPEQDEWTYLIPGWATPEVPVTSYVCDVWVCSLLKAAGLFEWAGVPAQSIQCTEFTNWDVYSLDFFQSAPVRPPQCVAADPNNPLCQLTGLYSLELNLAGTVAPYPGMRQHCAGLSPNYYWANNTC